MAKTQRVVEKRGANHGLHVFFTIITCGLWAITGWPIATAMGRKTVTKVPVYQPPQQMPPQPYGPGPGDMHLGYRQPGHQPYMPPPQPGPYNQPPGPYGQPPRQ